MCVGEQRVKGTFRLLSRGSASKVSVVMVHNSRPEMLKQSLLGNDVRHIPHILQILVILMLLRRANNVSQPGSKLHKCRYRCFLNFQLN
jgi:hypothetical protein